MLIAATNGAIDRLRVVASDNAEIALAVEGTDPDDLEYAEELMLSGPFDEATGVRVYVRPKRGMVTERQPYMADVRVISESGRRAQVTVASDQALKLPTVQADPTPPTIPLEGVYEGFARVERVGTGLTATGRGRAFEREYTTRLTARLYPAVGGRAVLVIEDPLHLLHPEGRWVGEVVLADGSVELPAYTLLGPVTHAGQLLHVVARAEAATLAEDPGSAGWAGRIAFSPTVWFDGIAAGARRPFARWTITLSRSGDLPTGDVAPEVDAPAQGSDPGAEAIMPFAGTESAVYSALAGSTRQALFDVRSLGATPTLSDCHPQFTSGDPAAREARLDVVSRGWTTYDGMTTEYGYAGGSVNYYPPQCPISVCGGQNLDGIAVDAFSPILRVLAARVTGFDRSTPLNSFMFTFDDPADVYVTSSGRRLKGAVPCALDLDPNGTVVEGSISMDLSGTSTAACTAMAGTFDCTPVDVGGTDPGPRRLGGTLVFGGETIRIPDSVVTQVCAFSELPAGCAEGLLCDRTGPLDLHRLSSDPASVDPRSGDLACEGSAGTAALPFDATPISLEDLMAACDADVPEVLGPGSAVSPSATDRAGLDELSWADDTDCLTPLRFMTVLGALTDPARSRGFAEDRIEDALAARWLARWVALHAEYASEGVERASLLGGVEQVAGTAELERMLAASVEGWRLLLNPRIASGLVNLAPGALAAPDYRTRRLTGAPPVEPHYTQGDGLLVAMAIALNAQADLIAEIVERYAFAGARGLPASVRTALRYQLPIRALIAGLADRVAFARLAALPAWTSRFESEMAGVEAARARALARIDGLVRGSNPLGIEEADLPLYFQEIRTDAGGRFVALTDYLLGNSGTPQAIVPMLVADAGEAFEAARTSYLVEAARMVNADNDETARLRRVGTAKYEAGVELQDLCGVEAFTDGMGNPLPAEEIVDSLASDADLSRCWFRAEKPECRVQKQIDPMNFEAGAEDESLRAPEFTLCVASLLSTTADDAATYLYAPWGPDTVFPLAFNVPGPLFAFRPLRFFEQLIVGSDPNRLLTPDFSLANWSGPTQTVAYGIDNLRICGDDESGNELCVGPNIELDVLQFPTDSNPCINEKFPDFPGFLPELIVDDSVDPPEYSMRCRARMPFSGPDVELPYSSEAFSEPLFEIPSSSFAAAARFCRRAGRPGDAPSFLRRVEQRPRECYTGSIGTQALAINSLLTAVDVVHQEGVDKLDEYEINMDSCFALRAGNMDLEGALAAHNEAVFAKLDAKLAWDIAAVWANNTADCLDSIASAESKVQYGLAGGACAARALEGSFTTVSLGLENDIEHLDRSHELTMLQIENSTEQQRCEIEAELALVGARTNALQMIQTMEELVSVYQDLEVARQGVNVALDRGRGSILYAEESGVRTVGRDPWLDEDVTAFRKKMRLARRGAYLAVRAVEYEFQMSLAERGDVLTAQTPSDLEDVLSSLLQITATQTLEGARPAELTEVFSLRQHLLQLQDRSRDPVPGAHALNEKERFRAYLLDPRFAVYQDGELVGHRIPFEIAPLAALDRGVSRGIPIVSDNSCAERLWSVNVTLQGDEAEMIRGLTPHVNLEVRKQNAFYANWCAPDNHVQPFQVSSVRPSRNLFREPGIAEGFDPATGGDDTESFAKGRVQAMINIEPKEFVSDDYSDGATTELAARLLFGGYELYIPATSLAAIDEDGNPVGDGLVLSEVEDILLRVDYLSVAR